MVYWPLVLAAAAAVAVEAAAVVEAGQLLQLPPPGEGAWPDLLHLLLQSHPYPLQNPSEH